MKMLKIMPLALILLALAVFVPSPALMEGTFFTLYGQFTAVAAGFAAMLLNKTRKLTLNLGGSDAEMEAIERVKTPALAFCCTAAALVGARLLYCLVRYDFYLFDVGLAGILRIWEGGFMLYGAAAGAMLAAFALAKAKGASAAVVLDQIAAPGMMAVALTRMAEGTTTEGVGTWIENDFFCRFPFAVQNEWGEWQLAVYLFESIAAVIILFALLRMRGKAPGEKILTAILLYAGCQVVLESMRMDACLRIGFVRVSQVLSGIAILAVTLIRTRRFGKKTAAVNGALCVAGIAVCGIIEWALDKTSVSNLILYPVMIAVCAALVWNAMRYQKTK